MAAKKKVIEQIGDTLPVDATTAGVAASEVKAAKAAKEPKAEKAPKVELVTQNGISRPAAGSKTSRIWDISDELSAIAGSPAKRKDVIAKAMTEDLNAATAATQYGRWRKFFGLGAEVKETAAAAAGEEATA